MTAHIDEAFAYFAECVADYLAGADENERAHALTAR
jgi:hypothetical protein